MPCLDADAAWIAPLAQRAAAMPRERWARLDVRRLGAWVEHDAGFLQAWASGQRPEARRWLLRPPQHMQRRPLGLDTIALPLLPLLPHAGALAAWLGLSPAALWRLTLPGAWQRRQPLSQQHYRFHAQAKASGGWRLLEAPEGHLLGVQRRLLHGLLDLVPPHEAATGFTRGHSVIDHARLHAGQPVLLAFDLRDFFASVQASRVHALFATLGCSHEVARLLTALCTVATPEAVLRRHHAAGQLGWQQLQSLRDPHLPQGAPTSPALANLCAFGLDLRLAGLAHSCGAHYSRYADDLAISGPASLRSALPRMRAWVARIAAEEGFALNPRKTRCTAQGRQQRLCGIVVNHAPNLPRQEFDRLKATLHRCATQGAAAQNREGIVAWREHVAGRVAWATQLNPAKARRLQRMFDAVDWAR